MNAQPATRILILGGGFGGVSTAQELVKRFKRDRSVEITLVNRDNYFVFVPMLASAAAGTIETLHVVAPIRRLLRRGVRFRAEEVIGIDLAHRLVTTVSATTGRERQLPYDHLVIALGNVVNLSRLPGVAQHSRTIKTLGDALAIRNHVLKMLEAADIETDPIVRREMLNLVVVGGGFSGVEMVGELNDMVRDVVRHYSAIPKEDLHVILVHPSDRLLPELSPKIADYALKALRKRGVEVRMNTRLAGATPHEAVLQGGAKIPTRTLIAAVGNAPPPVLDQLDVKKDRGKLAVDPFMQVEGARGVWALGDNAIVPNAAWTDGRPSPPTAQFAIRQAKTLAHNIAAAIRGGTPKPFTFGGLGMFCLVGHGAGVGETKFGIKLKGRLGWFMWRGIYWAKMPSLGRRFQVGMDWFMDLFLSRELAQVNLDRSRTVGHEHYEPGEAIIQQGDPGDSFYLITSGEVEVVRQEATGNELVLARLRQGEYFGETALLEQGRRNATVRALTPVDVVTIGREDFSTLAGAWVQFAEQIREVSDKRSAQMATTAELPVSERSPASAATAVLLGGLTLITGRLVRVDSGAEIPLIRELMSLGRSSDNNIIVPDAAASRRHALIQREADDYWIEDLGGTNGTWVNNVQLTERAHLRTGDRIRIGRVEYIFELVRPPAADAPDPTTASITNMIQALDAWPPAGVASNSGADRPSVEAMLHESAASRASVAAESVTDRIRGLNEPGAPSRPLGNQVVSGRPAIPGVGPSQAVAATATSPRVVMQAQAGPEAGRSFEIGPAGATLGRAAENAIVLADARLSRRHARITLEEGVFWLADLGSVNGTAVNGSRLQAPHPLKTGDMVDLGRSRFVVAISGGPGR
ncbi:MAG: FAD-dependent oxidoreductase [Chloroflexi bacterium]|nr:FAD-dependent oxidoreductase [Chloroflexota bacterium]